MRPSSRLTILVATYERPLLLKQQLAYLSHSEVTAQVIVLDSSADNSAGQNREAADTAGFEYSRHSQEISVFSKLAVGLQAVETPYCVVLADDDFLRMTALDEIVDCLDRAPDHSAAHGLYFEFHADEDTVHIRNLVYSRAHLQQQSGTGRLRALLSDYEALTYAVSRTDSARQAFSLAARQSSTLGQELLESTAIAVSGKVARLPILSHGRRAGSSLGYLRAHPLDWLAVEPQGLFQAYGPYRDAVLGMLATTDDEDRREVERQVDLAHLAYLARYMAPDVLAKLAAPRPKGADDTELAEHAWEVLASVTGPPWLRAFRGPNHTLRAIRRWWRRRRLRYTVQSLMERNGESVLVCRADHDVSVRLYGQFLSGFAAASPQPATKTVLGELGRELVALTHGADTRA